MANSAAFLGILLGLAREKEYAIWQQYSQATTKKSPTPPSPPPLIYDFVGGFCFMVLWLNLSTIMPMIYWKSEQQVQICVFTQCQFDVRSAPHFHCMTTDCSWSFSNYAWVTCKYTDCANCTRHGSARSDLYTHFTRVPSSPHHASSSIKMFIYTEEMEDLWSLCTSIITYNLRPKS